MLHLFAALTEFKGGGVYWCGVCCRGRCPALTKLYVDDQGYTIRHNVALALLLIARKL